MKVYKQGWLLHREEVALLQEPATLAAETVAEDSIQLLKQTQVLMREFLACAELYTLRQQYALALYMLHQAAEQTLHTLLACDTGLKITTHNLDKLIRYNAMWDASILKLFPRHNDEDRRLFGLLQQAYVEARYGDEKFKVAQSDSRLVAELVRGLTQRLG